MSTLDSEDFWLEQWYGAMNSRSGWEVGSEWQAPSPSLVLTLWLVPSLKKQFFIRE